MGSSFNANRRGIFLKDANTIFAQSFSSRRAASQSRSLVHSCLPVTHGCGEPRRGGHPRIILANGCRLCEEILLRPRYPPLPSVSTMIFMGDMGSGLSQPDSCGRGSGEFRNDEIMKILYSKPPKAHTSRKYQRFGNRIASCLSQSSNLLQDLLIHLCELTLALKCHPLSQVSMSIVPRFWQFRRRGTRKKG